MSTTTRVVVVGGGYAGVLAANRLRQRPDIDVTLVNPRPQFVERIRLHQLVAGNDDAIEDYSTVLADSVTLVVDSAERIDVAAHSLRLASGATLDYDYLIYAVGSTAPVPAAVPGAAEFAYPLGELEAAQRLAARLADIPMQAPIVVVGGGLTGIEAASEFAEAGRNVTLVTGALGPSLTKGGLNAATRSLAVEYAERGIRVNAVALGIIRTPMHADEEYAALAQLNPQHRIGELDEVVEAVLYLEHGGFVTGEILHVDGGQHAGH